MIADVRLSYFQGENIEVTADFPAEGVLPVQHITLRKGAQIVLSCRALQATIRIGSGGFTVVPWLKEGESE